MKNVVSFSMKGSDIWIAKTNRVFQIKHSDVAYNCTIH